MLMKADTMNAKVEIAYVNAMMLRENVWWRSR